MRGTIACSLCGTVNVGDPIRCIACGQEFAADADAARHAPPETTSVEAPTDELGRAARQQTVIEAADPDAVTDALRPGTTPVAAAAPAAAAPPPPPSAPAAAPPSAPADQCADTETSDAGDGVRFVVRLLLPDGDRRSVEIGAKPVSVGSGLDELGLTGDPRIGAGEARIQVEGETLFVVTDEDSRSVYRRLREEEKLLDGDVVLMGDVAAKFQHVPPGPAVDGSQQVLGGSANSPIGRLVFLRRDGSDGPLHDLPAGKTIVGRTDGHLNFPKDSRLSRRHVRFYATEVGVTVEDLGSRNGTYLRVRRKTPLQAGDALRVGSAGLKVRGPA